MSVPSMTRTVVRKNYALLTPESRVPGTVPGFKDCTVFTIIHSAMGAGLTQRQVVAGKGAIISGDTRTREIFVFVVSGKARIRIDSKMSELSHFHYAFVPPGAAYEIDQMPEGTGILTFEKTYQALADMQVPKSMVGDLRSAMGEPLMGDSSLQLQTLLPDNLSFDMAVNVLTFQPGAQLPMVECHVMEHGLLFLSGQGIYRLDNDWYPVVKGDCIWMAPYCLQWFGALGNEPASYIYYKDVNRS